MNHYKTGGTTLSIKKNYLYNLLYQILIIILPLITVPYVSRVLKPEGVGTFSYTSSIVRFFIIFGMLGIATYGKKMIAMRRDDKKELSKTFLSIYLLQLTLTIISLIIYLIFVNYFFEDDKIIAYLQTIALLAAVIDCSWFFMGIEDFKKIVTRNIIVKVLSVIAVFVFVKDHNDLDTYTIIMGLSSFISQSIMWLYIKRYIIITPISIKLIFSHIKPTFAFFLPQIAIQVYFLLNKVMLGIMSDNREVGLYDYADKILNLSLTVVTSLGTVMLPRMSYTFAKGNFALAQKYIIRSLEFSTLLAIGIMFGVAGISKELIPWYMGEEFNDTAKILIILSAAIIFKSWSGVFGSQYFVPLGKMREYSIALYSGAIINLIINVILIKPYGAIGAAIGTVSAEFVVAFIQFMYVLKTIKINKIIHKVIYQLCSGAIMLIVVRIIGNLLGPSIFTTVFQIITGFVSYLLLVIIFEVIFKDQLLLSEIKKRFKK